ncbi:NYN domain-containing protein [Parashewanella spongiae]|uniref:NYN domain-containing protein n=1 Tax=Parashewanella spongiae TaxID=342950 RepID=A0A3A6U3U8_9GAMM|nr:NYN domain-containing protein [Parashewanella spongiae]MCL1078830.1 NYN domain-containing protein [Parashewanella spongiae]RJY10661.1 NYN domain-containing protein [Parashewanella spongiae]
MKKIAIFVDVQNIYYTSKEAYGRQFDYKRLWQQLGYEGEIVIANAYAIARNDNGQIKFQDALRHIGFEVKLKPFIQRADGSAKGDWDVGITIDIMECASSVDTIVLLSGDGDFSLLLDKVRQKYHVETQVFGVPSLTAKALIDATTIFHEINHSLLR